MKNIVNKIKQLEPKEVVVIGDVMLDEYIFGDVSRISPEAPVPILKEQKREWSLGGAANVALNCKHIGCKVDLIGVTGKSDRAGQKLFSMLTESGISTAGILESNQRVTTCKKRAISNSQQLIRIDLEDNKQLTKDEFLEIEKILDRLIRPGIVVLISDYAKGVVTPQLLSKVVSLAKQKRSQVLLDPKGKNFDKYQGINYLKPNLKEFYQILDFYGLSRDETIVENGRKVCQLLSLNGLIVTMGEKGIEYISEDENIFVPACKKEVFDLTGAGDTVFAFLALGLALKLPMKQCLRLANHAAAVAVSHLKTYAVSLDELIDKGIESTEKIYNDWAFLKIELDWLKLEHKKIVFTNGCFDLLHSGHIHVLTEAKKLGDILVVAINTDDSVKRFKGPSRPIKTFSERAAVLAAIGVVDFVVSFDQDTPKELIEYLRPDVLVKGGDYKAEKIAGYDFMIATGGLVQIIDFKEGLSTSNLIKAINLRQDSGAEVHE